MSSMAAAVQLLAAVVEDAAASFVGLDWEVDDSDISNLAAALERAVKAGDGWTGEHHRISSWFLADGSHAAERHAKALQALARSLEEDVSAADLGGLAETAMGLAEEAEDSVADAAAEAAELGRSAVAHARAGQVDQAREALQAACAIERNYGDAPAWGDALVAFSAVVDIVAAEEALSDAAEEVVLAAVIREALERSPVGWDALRSGSVQVISDWATQEGLQACQRPWGLALSHVDSSALITPAEVLDAASVPLRDPEIAQ